MSDIPTAHVVVFVIEKLAGIFTPGTRFTCNPPLIEFNSPAELVPSETPYVPRLRPYNAVN